MSLGDKSWPPQDCVAWPVKENTLVWAECEHNGEKHQAPFVIKAGTELAGHPNMLRKAGAVQPEPVQESWEGHGNHERNFAPSSTRAITPWAHPVRADLARGYIVDANDNYVCPLRASRSDEYNNEIAKALNAYASTPSAIERKLDKPAMVGSTRFGVGIKWETVIERAQREHVYQVTPEKEAARMERVRTFVDEIRDGPHREESTVSQVGVCPRCGVNRFEAPCPNGHMAATMGQCPMSGRADDGVEKP